MVPMDYCHVLCDPLLGIAATTNKLCSVQATFARWQDHSQAGTYPPHICVRAPEVQLSKDFGENDASALHQQRLEEAHKAYLNKLAADGICAKSDDVMFLEKALNAEQLYKEIMPVVKAQAMVILASCKLSVFHTSEQGNVELSGWEENSVVKIIAKDMLADIPVLCFRVVSIVEAKEFMAVAKSKPKNSCMCPRTSRWPMLLSPACRFNL